MSTPQPNYSLSEINSQLLTRLDAREELLKFTEYTKPDFEASDHHRIIAESLEWFEREVVAQNSPRLLIEAPPRHTKSELGSRRFPAWCLGKHPDWQFISTTYSGEFASDFGRDVRDIVSSQEYQRLFDTQLRADSAAVNRWQTTQGGVYVSVGVGGPITGRGAHVALLDDPIKNRQDADSETVKDSIWKWYTSTLYTRLMPGGGIIMILTRWADDDIAGRALEVESFRRVTLPAVTDGQALWPAWYPIAALEKIKAAISPRDWAALYQQNPTPEEGSYFSRDGFRRFDLGSQPYGHTYITSDFAVTESAEADFTVFGHWIIDSVGDWWLVDRYKDQVSADKWVNVLVRWFKDKSPMKFFGEGGVIRRATEPLIKQQMNEQGASTTLEWITRNRDKPAMASAFRGLCEMGKVHIPLTDWGEDFIATCLKFPAGAHDDDVDMGALVGLAVDQGIEYPEPEPPKPSETKPDYVTETKEDSFKLM